jgi:hypothetical protein
MISMTTRILVCRQAVLAVLDNCLVFVVGEDVPRIGAAVSPLGGTKKRLMVFVRMAACGSLKNNNPRLSLDGRRQLRRTRRPLKNVYCDIFTAC